MNVFTFGVGMFGFPVLNHIADNEDFTFYAYEKNREVADSLRTTRRHPIFFPGVELSSRVTLVSDYTSVLRDMDIVILVIPYQFLKDFLSEISAYLKP